MLHLLYVLAFTLIAFVAVSNLIRSLITISTDSQRYYGSKSNSSISQNSHPNDPVVSRFSPLTHPELLDDSGKPINEPLLVMRSVTVEDARKQLDAIYDASPSNKKEMED